MAKLGANLLLIFLVISCFSFVIKWLVFRYTATLPLVPQIYSAAKGITYVFSDVGRNINSSLRRISSGKVEGGGGLKLGFGHGFKVGLGEKPGVVQRFQSTVGEAMVKMMIKLGIVPSFPFDQSAYRYLQSGVDMISGSTNKKGQSGVGIMRELLDRGKESSKLHGARRDGNPPGVTLSNHSEEVIRNFLKNPSLWNSKETEARQPHYEDKILHMLFKHETVIEELKEENRHLKKVLAENLKVPPKNLQTNIKESRAKSDCPCSDCMEAQRRHTKST